MVITMVNQKYIPSVYLDDNNSHLIILDQTLLPGQEKYLKLSTLREIWEAIFKLQVRGAPAIGIAAAYGLYLTAKLSSAHTPEDLIEEVKRNKLYLETSRPTAVNLFWALNRMENRLNISKENGASYNELLEALKSEADAIRTEDENVCRQIGENALSLLKPGFGILTHCNAGTIATARYGTALAPIYLGHEREYNFKVYADETRPLLQGSRLTAWELERMGIDVTLICDNMAATVMDQGKINAILVGCDRVAANGDTANKIGTMNVAILAKYFNIPFYVCAPKSTIDMACKDSQDIKIEIRSELEITETWFKERMAPKNIKTYNPAFDITDHKLITAIITEDKIVYPPFKDNLALLMDNYIKNSTR